MGAEVILDLFGGAGGASFGVHSLFPDATVLSIDNDLDSCRTHLAWWDASHLCRRGPLPDIAVSESRRRTLGLSSLYGLLYGWQTSGDRRRDGLSDL